MSSVTCRRHQSVRAAVACAQMMICACIFECEALSEH